MLPAYKVAKFLGIPIIFLSLQPHLNPFLNERQDQP